MFSLVLINIIAGLGIQGSISTRDLTAITGLSPFLPEFIKSSSHGIGFPGTDRYMHKILFV